MTGLHISLLAPDAALFAPFGKFISPPDADGQRRFYSEQLHDRPSASAPVLHTNHVAPKSLPATIDQMERHPHAAQTFVPMDVSRYVVVVTPTGEDGAPLCDQALGFEMPGSLGVIYHPGVWHMGAMVLDRAGHFAVLMWRGGPLPDDEFRTISPITIG
ncbi:ureidoglycolate lyase [Falsihalocynthiibacter sp. BN13B15]|uniref:ureidoglycolate lyase n=1 Tax=Falsihalocynthiibacter sp. BN13B15 TaxID=3240871 RepID=UPI0035101F7F